MVVRADAVAEQQEHAVVVRPAREPAHEPRPALRPGEGDRGEDYFGTDMSAYCRPSRQSTSWIKLGQGTGWGVFSHRLPSKVLNARQRPNRNSAAPYGFSSLTPWGSSRTPRVRHQGRCIRVRETSKMMSRVAGANATYTTRPSAEATTSNRPRGVTVPRSQRLAPASTGAHRSQTFAFSRSPSR